MVSALAKAASSKPRASGDDPRVPGRAMISVR